MPSIRAKDIEALLEHTKNLTTTPVEGMALLAATIRWFERLYGYSEFNREAILAELGWYFDHFEENDRIKTNATRGLTS